MIYLINPTPKPRMTRRDVWKKRPAVLRYRAFCDECRLKGVRLSESGCHVIFRIPMPKSWSGRKRRRMAGTAHTQRPDVDNYLKALLDAMYEDDSGVWDIRVTKFWAEVGSIEVIDCASPPQSL